MCTPFVLVYKAMEVYKSTDGTELAVIAATWEARFWAKVDKDGPLPSDTLLGPCWRWTARICHRDAERVRRFRKAVA